MKLISKIFTHVEEKASLIVYVAMLILTFANVIGRYVLKSSISFTEEITTNLFVLISVIGTGIAAKTRSHLGLSAFTEILPPRTQRIISAIGNLLGAFFGVMLFYTGCLMVSNQIKLQTMSPTLQMPNWIYGIFLPIGAVFITIRFLGAAIEDFKKLNETGKGEDAK